MKPVLVIGGGLAGVASAFELSRRGRAVHLFESGTELAGETSHANGGMMTPSQAEPWNHPGITRELLLSLFDPHAAVKARPLAFLAAWKWGLSFLAHANSRHYELAMAANFALARRSAELTAHWSDEYRLQFAENRNGTMKVFRSQHDWDAARAHSRALAHLGLEWQELQGVALLQKEPSLAPVADGICGGLFFPADSVGNARLFTRELADRARAHGMHLHLDEPVHSLGQEGGVVTGVNTHKDQYSGEVVLAAGVASPKLAASVGVTLQMAPVKGYSVTLPGLALQTGAPQIAVLDEARHTAIVPIGDDVRLVGTAEIAGMDKSIPHERLMNLQNVFSGLFPKLALDWDGEAINWCGLRPMTARSIPYIGISGGSGLWLNTGHGHLGWTQAAGAAELLADLMSGDAPKLDPRPFQP